MRYIITITSLRVYGWRAFGRHLGLRDARRHFRRIVFCPC